MLEVVPYPFRVLPDHFFVRNIVTDVIVQTLKRRGEERREEKRREEERRGEERREEKRREEKRREEKRRQDKRREDKTRQDKRRQEKTRQDKTREDESYMIKICIRMNQFELYLHIHLHHSLYMVVHYLALASDYQIQ